MHTLQNDHNVYILGAGFSANRGLPTIKDFMYVMRDAHEWLISQGRIKEAKAIASVLEFRLDAASAAYRIRLDLENIEELFSLASASSRKLTQNIQLAISATLDFRLKTFSSPVIRFEASPTIDFIPSHWKKELFDGGNRAAFECPAYEFYLKSLLGTWNNNSNTCRNSFITFNYDLLLENSLENLSIPFSYGINSKSGSSTIVSNDGIDVLKLHGSINWGDQGKSKDSYTIHNSYEDLLKQNQIPQLVPPTWRKIFTGPLREIWDKSLSSLQKATRIIVIRFSIPPTDNHFKYLMAAGLQNNISLREMVFVNPDRENLEQRAKTLFGDVSNTSYIKYMPGGIENFLTHSIDSITINDLGRPIPKSIQNIYLSS